MTPLPGVGHAVLPEWCHDNELQPSALLGQAAAPFNMEGSMCVCAVALALGEAAGGRPCCSPSIPWAVKAVCH